jgi:hypothetical protein
MYKNQLNVSVLEGIRNGNVAMTVLLRQSALLTQKTSEVPTVSVTIRRIV